MNIFITGDSHLGALNRALKAEPSLSAHHKIYLNPLGNSELSHQPYFAVRHDHIEITLEKYRMRIKCLPPTGKKTDVLVVSFLFYTLGLLRDRNLWRTYSPATLAGKNDRRLLSNSTLKKMVLTQQRYNLELIEELKKLVPAIVVLEGPRLFSHHTVFARSDSEILLEIDQIYRETINKELEAQGISVIRCRAETFSPDTGLMLDEYRTSREGDLHHASAKFGSLVLQDLVSHIENIECMAS